MAELPSWLPPNWLPLATVLAKCEEHVRDEGDQLEACCHWLLAVNHFLEQHPNIRDEGLTRPARVLLRFLHDVKRGHSPDLLFKCNRIIGRPREESSAAIKAAAGACLDLLIQCKLKEQEAAEVVVSKLKEYDIGYAHHNGHGSVSIVSIDAKQVSRWRYELRSMKAHSESKRIFEQIRERLRDLPPELTPQEAMALVDNCVRGLRHEGF
jgi:hypothetical protein